MDIVALGKKLANLKVRWVRLTVEVNGALETRAGILAAVISEQLDPQTRTVIYCGGGDESAYLAHMMNAHREGQEWSAYFTDFGFIVANTGEELNDVSSVVVAARPESDEHARGILGLLSDTPAFVNEVNHSLAGFKLLQA